MVLAIFAFSMVSHEPLFAITYYLRSTPCCTFFTHGWNELKLMLTRLSRVNDMNAMTKQTRLHFKQHRQLSEKCPPLA